ncbi:putative esterase [Gordonia effusa NBRC 100432]|uniref:Putative esterase n=1 Tax=Gordonia effusa NBRC 100432 TaxID=1077974 RepID=H0QUU3_9ACTN|nr:serine hydrolase domain-containing protein [Gordonia effusa]GAB16594.1 putative esterase [Gordonia effusa NBRC 100432]
MSTRTEASSLPDRLASHLDPVVQAATDGPLTGEGRVPGVVAGVTTDTETAYLSASGRRALDTETSMTTDTVFGIFSTSKAITATTALTLVDEGLLDLDAPADTYLPELTDIQVIEGFDNAGNRILRPAATVPTTRQLLTHTSGFGYAFYSDRYLRLAQDFEVPDIATCKRASIQTPLLFDPGTDWMYGTGLDWTGLVIEAITGQRLGDVMAERIFTPLGMSDTAFGVDNAARERLTTLHHRRPDGSLKPNHRFAPIPDPEVHMGGHGLYSTVGDYLTFLRMWLRDGRADDGTQVVAVDTIALASEDHLHPLTLRDLTTTMPPLSNDTKFLPEQSWSLAFARDGVTAPTGRAAGSLSWAGLANLYFWLDPHNKIAGYWAAQVFPFADRVCFEHYQSFEAAVYRALKS